MRTATGEATWRQTGTRLAVAVWTRYHLAAFLAGHELRPKVRQPFVPVSADARPRGVGTWQRPDLRLRA